MTRDALVFGESGSTEDDSAVKHSLGKQVSY